MSDTLGRMSAPTLAVVVVAAGSGTRLGHAEPKAFVPLAGRSLLEHALERIFTLAMMCCPPGHVHLTRTASG